MIVAEKLSAADYIPLKSLYVHRDLLWSWTARTIQARYKQSILGGLWAVIQPAARALILTVIFTQFIPIDTGTIPYIIFSYTAMVPWMLFASSLTDMVDSLVVNMNLVSKISFPREILPLAALLARLLDFAIAGGLLLLLMLFYQIPVWGLGLLYLPLIILVPKNKTTC
jgi:lipopolysaccharide transport system permease protein